MRPVTVRQSAAGFTQWVVLDRYTKGFVVGLAVRYSSNGNMTYSVEHTFDNVLAPFYASGAITRSGTTCTIPYTNHGLAVNDYVGIRGGGSPFDGDYAVASVVDQNNVTVTVANSGPTFAAQGAQIIIGRVYQHDILNAKTVGDDGNYIAPPVACRLNVTAYTAGYADLIVVQGGLA